MKRVRMEVSGVVLRERRVTDLPGFDELVTDIRAQIVRLIRLADDGRCGSLTIAVHTDGAGCDHE